MSGRRLGGLFNYSMYTHVLSAKAFDLEFPVIIIVNLLNSVGLRLKTNLFHTARR